MKIALKLLTSIAAVALSASATLAQDGNAEAGEDVFKKCRACHDIGPDAKNKVGPVLNGLIGRKSGTVEGFAYSDAMKAKADAPNGTIVGKALEAHTNGMGRIRMLVVLH